MRRAYGEALPRRVRVEWGHAALGAAAEAQVAPPAGATSLFMEEQGAAVARPAAAERAAKAARRVERPSRS